MFAQIAAIIIVKPYGDDMKTNQEKELKAIIKKDKVLMHAISELERELERYKANKRDHSQTDSNRRERTHVEESVSVHTASGHATATFKFKDGEKPAEGTREDKDLSMIII